MNDDKEFIATMLVYVLGGGIIVGLGIIGLAWLLGVV